MVMTLILILSKLVDISKYTALWRNLCHATLLKSHFCMGDFLQICWVFPGHLFRRKRGAGVVIFASRKFKFKLFLNDLWYEPETL